MFPPEVIKEKATANSTQTDYSGLQVRLNHAQGDGVGALGPTPLVDMDSSLTFASPVITRYPLMLQLGGLEQCE